MNEDEFWKAEWSDTCGVCGERMLDDHLVFEIKVTKVWDDNEEVFFMTQVCQEACVDKAFELLAKDSPEFKRFYKFRRDLPRPPDDFEQYDCSGCGMRKNSSGRHILVYGLGPYHLAYVQMEQIYCSYKCYKDSLKLGKDYVRTMLDKYGKAAL